MTLPMATTVTGAGAPFIVPPNEPIPKSSTISKMQKFKTSICRNFQNGNCQMGEACHFAHGDEDLRKSTDVRFINTLAFADKHL